jgi:hypothetical protein
VSPPLQEKQPSEPPQSQFFVFKAAGKFCKIIFSIVVFYFLIIYYIK